MVILLYGPPGCGKGTQSAFITRRLQIPAISTGDMLRAACEDGTQNGATCALINSGILVSDDLVNSMVATRIAQPDCDSGFLLDGYPRTVGQARYLRSLIERRYWPDPSIIHLDVPRSVLIDRVTSRRQCPACGKIYNLLYSPPATPDMCDADGCSLTRRADDEDQVVMDRLNAYEQMTSPVIEHYRHGRYHRIDGDRPPGEISREIERLLKSATASRQQAPVQKRISARAHLPR